MYAPTIISGTATTSCTAVFCTASQKTGSSRTALMLPVPANDTGWSMPGQCRAAMTKMATSGPTMKTRYQASAGTARMTPPCVRRFVTEADGGGVTGPRTEAPPGADESIVIGGLAKARARGSGRAVGGFQGGAHGGRARPPGEGGAGRGDQLLGRGRRDVEVGQERLADPVAELLGLGDQREVLADRVGHQCHVPAALGDEARHDVGAVHEADELLDRGQLPDAVRTDPEADEGIRAQDGRLLVGGARSERPAPDLGVPGGLRRDLGQGG